ncbi:hypothetical protein LO80_01395 [Candidatus Francisella endociliophora]|uniref:Uncharacterized protein n=1 Tax=Candidatus Francisella endociliophora TaxID=653937 RepID=A0A097EMG0_9GAMM|nr:hypothetical protein [Francisella sp. FSC1006]AIT08759.1 hypothetical protein LO80_01395 [Francisella sp. FSC1006]
MLYKQINLSSSYASCLIDDPNYALSIDTYIIQEDKQTSLFIELDSIFEYVGIKDINKIIDEIKKVKTALLYTETINNKTKNFVYYQYLNLVLALVHFYLRKNGNDTNKLKDAIGDLYQNIILEWHKYDPDLVSSLGIFFR